ncbi:9394_t:CDS:2 [Acaulospora colombiana]|uniref:9394_t:CDS:1 n=1 Tax=Acaulospora colombiana TaxID=27376 RepID=A0ACA9K554_9GLOM|nr:9394_t:CDS:2 [Acaulospora colombiana]
MSSSDAGALPAKNPKKLEDAPVTSNQSTVKEKLENNNGIAAAVARSLTRGVAVYFSRPVRLFRPSKAVNTLLGVVLWESYGFSSEHLEKLYPHHPIMVAATSGAIAGGCQSLMAAPAENVRIVLEAGAGAKADPVKKFLEKPTQIPTTHSGWMHAWKQVFQGPQPLAKAETREEIRELNRWSKEIKSMAGRGWDGWAWGCGKDIKVASNVAFLSVHELEQFRLSMPNGKPLSDKTRTSTARISQGVTLVTGGVVAGLGYELVCRPFDNARRFVYLDDMHKRAERSASDRTGSGSHPKSVKLESRVRVVTRVILERLKYDGILPFFANPQQSPHTPEPYTSGASRALHGMLRTLARVGPWGVGFLLYESLGGNLPQV